MLLQKLYEYADRLDDLPPPNYLKRPIGWVIVLTEKGALTGMIPTGTPGDRKTWKQWTVPNLVRANAIKAKLLADNGEYVLGITREDGDPEKVSKRHEAFIQSVRDCYEATSNEDVGAVLKFLENHDPAAFKIHDDFDPSHELTFRIGDDRFPFEHPDVQRYWASTFEDEDADKMPCIVTGKPCVPEKRLQLKIKGIPGGQSSGNAFISANASAFESFGLEASAISPISRDAAERFSIALNQLLSESDTHFVTGPVVFVYWTRDKTDMNPVSTLKEPDPGEVKKLFDSVFSARETKTVEDENDFYAVVLSASGSRVVVRDWIETTVGMVKRSIVRWFTLQKIINWDGSESEPIKLAAINGATVRDFKDLPARVPRLLFKFAITCAQGTRLPDDLLFQAVKRNRAEQGVTRPRAALIKMILLSQGEFGLQEDSMENLDGAHLTGDARDAYLCGRLLSVLEYVQRAALGSVGANIVDRYYGTASSAPASVFGTLMRGAQAHLSKLRKTKTGLYVNLEKQLEEICADLSQYPATLDMKKQALFALGYYHQRAHRPTKTENDE